jgi:O-antigen ligase
VAGPAARAAWTIAAVLAAFPVVAFVRTAGVPWPVRLAVLVQLALSWSAPGHALVLLGGLLPLTTVLAGAARLPVGGTTLAEAMVVTTLAPWLLARGIRRADGPPLAARLVAPVLAFGAIAGASGLVQLPPVALQSGGWGPYFGELWTFFSRDFYWHSDDTKPIEDAMLVLEGLGLLLMTAAVCAGRPAVSTRLPLVMVAGTAAAAALNVHRLISAALRSDAPWRALTQLALMARVSMHYDRNAAGSVFAMMAILGAGCAYGSRLRRLAAGSLVLTILAGLWLTGSRAAIGAVFVAALLWTLSRVRVAPRARLRYAAIAGLLAAGAALVALLYPHGRNPSVEASINGRRELALTAARMFQANPVWGVGIGRFYDSSTEYGTPALFAVLPADNPRENAHNNFLQVLAELGSTGFVALLWLLGAVLAPAMIRRTADAATAGALTFVLTWLTGHPLLVAEAVYPFFLVLGIVAAASAFDGSTPAAVDWRATRGAVLLGLIVLLTLPLRVVHASRNANLEHVGYGVSRWHPDPDVERFRWAGPAATLFVPSNAASVLLPLRKPPGSPPVDVAIMLDGRLVNRVALTTDDWRMVHMIVPPGPARFRRVDLRADTGSAVPDAAARASEPRIMVGKIRTAGR